MAVVLYPCGHYLNDQVRGDHVKLVWEHDTRTLLRTEIKKNYEFIGSPRVEGANPWYAGERRSAPRATIGSSSAGATPVTGCSGAPARRTGWLRETRLSGSMSGDGVMLRRLQRRPGIVFWHSPEAPVEASDRARPPRRRRWRSRPKATKPSALVPTRRRG
jgi:hypothetical protein